MNDTHHKIEVKYRKMLMSKSGEERLIMGCSMFDAAKQIVKSSIISQNPKITPQMLRRRIFSRFYGMEFSEDEKEKIFA